MGSAGAFLLLHALQEKPGMAVPDPTAEWRKGLNVTEKSAVEKAAMERTRSLLLSSIRRNQNEAIRLFVEHGLHGENAFAKTVIGVVAQYIRDGRQEEVMEERSWISGRLFAFGGRNALRFIVTEMIAEDTQNGQHSNAQKSSVVFDRLFKENVFERIFGTSTEKAKMINAFTYARRG
jgi:hypothetical protein